MHKNIFASIILALSLTLAACFSACDDDDSTAAPSVAISEANIEGDELCLMADIEAEGRTAEISIVITSQDEVTTKLRQAVSDDKYVNVLNIPEFHIHIDFAEEGIEAGDWLTLTVRDGNGKTTSARKEITQDEDEE